MRAKLNCIFNAKVYSIYHVCSKAEVVTLSATSVFKVSQSIMQSRFSHKWTVSIAHN